MNEQDFRQRFPQASPDVVRLNTATRAGGTDPGNRNPGTNPKLERDPGHGTLGQRQIQNLPQGKVFVRVTSFRSRLLDEDNLAEKYHIDCCRYAGLLRSDDPGAAKIEVRQEKVGKGEPEFVRIEIFKI